jgi:hypothetical protein
VEGIKHVLHIRPQLTRAVFRVREIGNHARTIAGRTIRFKQEVGFGGAVLMQVRRPCFRPDSSLSEIGGYLRDLM